MKSRSVIFVISAVLFVPFIYSSYPMPDACAEPSGPVKACTRIGTVTVKCCQDHIINRSPSNPGGTLVTYCTECTRNPDGTYSDCSERYIEASAGQPIPVPPSAVQRLQEGGILGEATTFPEASVAKGQRANISILPGGILQEGNNLTFSQANISSDDSSNNTLTMKQSDLVSGTPENTSKAVDVGEEEKNQGETTEETSAEETEDNGDEDEDISGEESQQQE
jgi:hypothetical protein